MNMQKNIKEAKKKMIIKLDKFECDLLRQPYPGSHSKPYEQ